MSLAVILSRIGMNIATESKIQLSENGENLHPYRTSILQFNWPMPAWIDWSIAILQLDKFEKEVMQINLTNISNKDLLHEYYMFY